MKFAFGVAALVFSSSAIAQACWIEWDFRDQPVNRGGQCTEKITIPDPERGFCKPMMDTDQVRKAASCPTTARVRDGAQVITAPVAARCIGITPPDAGGKADLVYYGGKGFIESRESLQSLCEGFDGKWKEQPNK